ncbi:hypothetical protein OIY81_1603 [Cryptosporidium canis]|uniref:Uncharacterized protein n=1 Tax=Cryptosporidium canis TaxID=195482 RepID=A0ABQ8P8M0_9CRYT|nr:hypothetical protein OJ252_1629 [Cryptosporidium canis]KAJ1611700.1 hypothetical protein OIY81_1603 [Cryptosporidium canis]
MILYDRLNNLERRVNEQNEAIKKIALYALEILDENDILWKHIMRDISTRANESSNRKIIDPAPRFRSKTPPPLEEPKSPKREQTMKVRKVLEELNDEIVLSILKKEAEQIKKCKRWRKGYLQK